VRCGGVSLLVLRWLLRRLEKRQARVAMGVALVAALVVIRAWLQSRWCQVGIGVGVWVYTGHCCCCCCCRCCTSVSEGF
jgi:hypothetical protein